MKLCMTALALLLALCLTAAMADEPVVYTSGDYTYVLLEDGTAEITGYTGTASDLTVPETLDGYLVTGIGTRAFNGRNTLVSVTIPDSITQLGVNPFLDCGRLTDIRVSSSHPTLATIDGVLFDKTENKLVCYPCAFTATGYTVPRGIRIIGDQAFGYCSTLASIRLPDTVTIIGTQAFFHCQALRNMTIPDGVTSIGAAAFYECRSLTDITIPDSVTSIGSYAFDACRALTSITIPDSVVELGANPFRDCRKLTDIRVLPSHPVLATIDGVLFNKTTKELICYPRGLTASAYTVPHGILSIGDYAFCGCDALASITLPDTLTSIGTHAFSFCDALTDIIIPDGVTVIGSSAFCYCRSLKSIILPDSITAIWQLAFHPINSHATFTVQQGSYAEQWCRYNGYHFTYPNANDWLLN